MKNCLLLFLLSMLIQHAFAQENGQLIIGSVSTNTARQIVKEFTRSHYIVETRNDFDRDGQDEQVIGANCKEGFCENYIFRELPNRRVQFVGMASFHHETYELVWRREKHKSANKQIMADIIYFKQENVGQGCLGRYRYNVKVGYELELEEVCRLPKEVLYLLNSYREHEQKNSQKRDILSNPDFIDFSDITYEENPEDFFPEPEKK